MSPGPDRRPVLVGLEPPRGRRRGPALAHTTSSGAALARLAGVPGPALGRHFVRVNLRRRGRADRRRALEIAARYAGRPLVLLGREVQRAFRLDAPWLERRGDLVAIPHPSGENLAYNDPATREAVGRALRELAGIAAPGQPPLIP